MDIGWLHLQHDVRGPHLAYIFDDRCSRITVIVIVERCTGAGVMLDRNLKTELLEPANGFRGGGDAAFTRPRFFRNSDSHAVPDLLGRSHRFVDGVDGELGSEG